MATFDDLPTETRILILQRLSSIDLRSFLISQARRGEAHATLAHAYHLKSCEPSKLTEPTQNTQATCKTFHLLAKEVLSHPQALPRCSGEEDKLEKQKGPASALCTTPQTSVNPVLAHAFATLFSSAACFNGEERRRAQWFLTLNGDVGKAFRRLPWAASGDGNGDSSGTAPLRQRREAYLRPGASWRGISVTFAHGPPITRLEIVKSYSSEDLNEEGRDHVEHLLVDLSPPPASSSSPSPSTDSGGFLTMGLLYDLLLTHGAVGDSSAATFGAETGAWDLLLGRRLRSYALLVEYECFILDDEELVDLCPEAEGSAILYVRGGDQDRRVEWDEEDDGGSGERWVPEMLGERPSIRPADVP